MEHILENRLSALNITLTDVQLKQFDRFYEILLQ